MERLGFAFLHFHLSDEFTRFLKPYSPKTKAAWRRRQLTFSNSPATITAVARSMGVAREDGKDPIKCARRKEGGETKHPKSFTGISFLVQGATIYPPGQQPA